LLPGVRFAATSAVGGPESIRGIIP
jgi:hypothetical protein